MRKKLLPILFLLLLNYTKAQVVQLSVFSEVSIITAGPGNELYEAFGHSAIRIKDPVLKLDVIYNYGIFDFDAPNFYSNFTKGKLVYMLGRYPFDIFLRGYNSDKRWVKQQTLNLTQQERQAFFMYLENNALEGNASYLYDPFYNNCASKLKDITKDILGDQVAFDDAHASENLSFRELMNNEIPWNTWGSLGINLALGSKLDNTASAEQYMYLPDYVYRVFKESTIKINGETKDLVRKEETILDYPELEQTIGIFNPLAVLTMLAFFGLLITIRDAIKRKRNKILDFLLFFTSGIIGILIVFLWFFTDHSTTPNNFNFLWAFAPNTIIAFFMLSSTLKNWLKNYFKLMLVFLLIIPILWVVEIQLFPKALIPIFILLFIRYVYLVKQFSDVEGR